MSIEERAANLIDCAMQRINFHVLNPITANILNQISSEKKLLPKISNLIHLLVICNQISASGYDEIYNTIKKYYKNVPYDYQSLTNWIDEYIKDQKLEIANFRKRLRQIESIIKEITAKITSNSDRNKLSSQIDELKRKMSASENENEKLMNEKNSIINDLKDQLLRSEGKLADLEIELYKTREKYGKKDNIHQTIEELLNEVKTGKAEYQKKLEEVKHAMQFDIDTLNEKCSLLRNDLNYALRQKFELEDKLKVVQDELCRKNAECTSLRAILNDSKPTKMKV